MSFLKRVRSLTRVVSYLVARPPPSTTESSPVVRVLKTASTIFTDYQPALSLLKLAVAHPYLTLFTVATLTDLPILLIGKVLIKGGRLLFRKMKTPFDDEWIPVTLPPR